MDIVKYNDLSLISKIKLGLKMKLLNKFTAAEDEYYSLTPPDKEWMVANGKKFWICPVSDEEFFENISDNTNNDVEEIKDDIIDTEEETTINNEKPILLDNFDNNDENDDSEKEETI